MKEAQLRQALRDCADVLQKELEMREQSGLQAYIDEVRLPLERAEELLAEVSQ